jgi:hypothetical protein
MHDLSDSRNKSLASCTETKRAEGEQVRPSTISRSPADGSSPTVRLGTLGARGRGI